uniref:alpha/beta fold hydrolase n=1 Tax=uncultured Pluralibacter sp. TaxID=1490864 RepID=UPI00261F42E8
KTLAQQDPEGYAEGCEALAHADLRAEIGAVRAPLLVIAGEHDPVTTVADADFLHQHVSGSREVILPASHLSNVEAPAAFSAALLDFFKEYQ